MPDFSVTVQEGQAAHAHMPELEAGLVRIGSDLLGDELDATITWTVVPPAHMFTEGQPSTTSMVIRSVDPTLTVQDREPFMRAVCDLWTATTGCTDHEILVTTIPGPLPF